MNLELSLNDLVLIRKALDFYSGEYPFIGFTFGQPSGEMKETIILFEKINIYISSLRYMKRVQQDFEKMLILNDFTR